MRIVHFTNNLIDGAGKAAYQLHQALLKHGIDSLMLVLTAGLKDPTVVELKPDNGASLIRNKIAWKVNAVRSSPRCLFNFNIPFVTWEGIQVLLKDVDIVCLYSIQAFLSSNLIRKIYLETKAPIVWTPLDIEPMTGGCHFNSGCMNFSRDCGNCPQLARGKADDISKRTLLQKKNDLKGFPITLVAGSSWAERCIKESSLFGANNVKNILLGVDEKIFSKVDKELARKHLQLPQDKKLILFGAFNLKDKRKGGEYLVAALERLQNRLLTAGEDCRDSVVMVTMGRQNGFHIEGLSFEHIHFGEIRDDKKLACAYQAADVLAVPSMDDFGPMMINQAFMCETPVVAFHVGVAPDLIKTKQAGFLAQNFSADDFSLGLNQCLFEKNDQVDDISQALREVCRSATQANRYISLFQEIRNRQSLREDGQLSLV